MEVSQEPTFDVHARLTILGCVQPTTLSLLPLNLNTAPSRDDLVFPISSATLHKLLLKAGLPYQEVLPDNETKRYKLDRAEDLILPPLFLAAKWMYENRDTIKTALEMVADYLRYRLIRADQKQVTLDIVHANPEGGFTKTSYQGPLDGLPAVLDVIGNQLPRKSSEDE